jgi:hypothetical protein
MLSTATSNCKHRYCYSFGVFKVVCIFLDPYRTPAYVAINSVCVYIYIYKQFWIIYKWSSIAEISCTSCPRNPTPCHVQSRSRHWRPSQTQFRPRPFLRPSSGEPPSSSQHSCFFPFYTFQFMLLTLISWVQFQKEGRRK